MKRSFLQLKVFELQALMEKCMLEIDVFNSSRQIDEINKISKESIVELDEDGFKGLLAYVFMKSKSNDSKQKNTFKTTLNDTQLVSRIEMADELKISLPTLRKWTRNKQIPNHKKIGGVVYYNRLEVMNYVNSKK